MATVAKSYTATGGAATVSATGLPSTLAVSLTDGEGNILGDTGDVTLLTAVGTTVTQTSADQVNPDNGGMIVALDMTAVGTGSVTLTIQGKDIASGKYYTLLTGAPVTTNGTNVYMVYRGAPATANVSANAAIPRTWRVVATANNANAVTYTVGASLTV